VTWAQWDLRESAASVVLEVVVGPKVSLALPVQLALPVALPLEGRVLRRPRKIPSMRALTAWRSYSTGATIWPTEWTT
jgi:hypothetical protein